MPEATIRQPRRGWILATLCLAQLMISLDVLIVNIALPSAQRWLTATTWSSRCQRPCC
jgi:hypothetical protein